MNNKFEFESANVSKFQLLRNDIYLSLQVILIFNKNHCKLLTI